MIRIIAIACLIVAGCQKRDPLYCGTHLSDPRCGPADAGIDDAPTDAPPGFFTIGGTVLGNLAGTGLVLENNTGDDLMITAAGSFQFTTPIEMGMPYAVTASSQPNDPSQTCTITNESGTATGNVTDVTVSCQTKAYMISGAVSGLATGQNVTLQLNGGNDVPIAGNGMPATPQPFMFTAPILSGATFGVSVGTPPSAQTCNVFSGNGTVGSADVSTVVVNCATNTFVISGEVSDLTGTVVLTDGTNMISPSANGSFSFPPLASGTSYTVSVMTQPGYPPRAQTCMVTNGGPFNITSNVTNVTVDCMTNTYSIGGTMANLSGTVVLADNGIDLKSLSNNNNYTFGTSIASGSTYSVSVNTQPAHQWCTVSKPSGTVANLAITTVSTACDSGIKCGTDTCDPTMESCCNPEGAPGPGAPKCQGGGCAALSLPCDSASDCSWAGTAGSCCYAVNGTNKSASCTTSCTTGGGTTRVILCDPAVADACVMPLTCTAYSGLTGYFACQ